MSAVQISSTARTATPQTAQETSQQMSPQIPWPEANHACLVMEFARLRQKLSAANQDSESLSVDRSLDDALQQLRESLEPPSAIDRLSAIFSLSTFERQIVLLSAGIEMDSTLAAQCSEALGRSSRDARGSITFSLALATLDNPHWSALAPSAPLRRFRLIELESGNGLTTAPIRLDDRILHYLAGVNQLDTRLENLLQTRHHPHWIAPEHSTLAAEAAEAIDPINLSSPEALLLHLCGDDPRGQEDIAVLIAHSTGRHLFILPLENIAAISASESASADPSQPVAQSVQQLVTLFAREAALLPAILLVQCGAGTPNNAARQMLERLPAPLLVASRDPLRIDRRFLRYTVNKPGPASQKHLWAKALGNSSSSSDNLLDDLSEQFRLSAETIAAVAATAQATVRSGSETINADKLWAACRSLSRPRLEDHAERILPAAGWDDLILPEAQKQTLHQLAAQARHRMTVYESWGFAANGRRGLGITALFAGASGTGKTLAAEVLAKELRLDLYRIDLSAVVSKYIGESEKNLKQVFDAAEEGGVLLLFDEADALFGKRAEVKDSHDRYANIEVSYLLQRMESFQGLAVLTTNFKSSMDKAFQRRLRFTVDFPFPGPQEREAIWQRAFPAKTPTSGLDIKRLAQLNMTGGNIRNIALNAAFLAAEAGSSVQMQHLLQATRQEAIKTDRPISDSETRGWA
jgi:hypothetical protein